MTNNLKEIEEAFHTYGIRYEVWHGHPYNQFIQIKVSFGKHYINIEPYVLGVIKHYRLYDSYADRNIRYEKVSSVIRYVTRTLDAYKQINVWCHIHGFGTDFNFNVKKVIFNNPATIVFWDDDTKTVVKCQNGDTFNPETGIAMCFMKKALGNKSNFNNTFKKYIKKNSEPKTTKAQTKKKHTKTYAHLDIDLIHRLLREHKWSIKEFAEYVGVDYSTACTWLRGGGIKKTTLNKLSKVLHISEEDLVK